MITFDQTTIEEVLEAKEAAGPNACITVNDILTCIVWMSPEDQTLGIRPFGVWELSQDEVDRLIEAGEPDDSVDALKHSLRKRFK